MEDIYDPILEKINAEGIELKHCPVLTTLNVIGGKWKPAILWHIQHRKIMRFGKLRRCIEGITEKMLTQQLRELENDGIINRKVYAEVPPKVEYSLTTYGETLYPLLEQMAIWGVKHLQRTSEEQQE